MIGSSTSRPSWIDERKKKRLRGDPSNSKLSLQLTRAGLRKIMPRCNLWKKRRGKEKRRKNARRKWKKPKNRPKLKSSRKKDRYHSAK